MLAPHASLPDPSLTLIGTPRAPVIRVFRWADTAHPDRVPEVAGLLGVSLGRSRMHTDDLAQPDAAEVASDARYRRARDARGELQTWTVKR
ncbi:hypothetical protein [Pararhodobacter zhoushanensis]|uniref:hypothetical protein n=1 Tax=Pararhodobacter zhoushanensis TaxID=2479545 RepID=UPI000F8E2FA0|nr:hypothetical protein [Pararhodobacter zhoushanensis]